MCQRSRWRVPRLAVAGSAGAVAAPLGDRVPEELGNAALAGAAGDLEAARRTDDLRNGGVDVQPLELVALRGEGRVDALPVEALCQRPPARLEGDCCQVVEQLVHAAVLALEDPCHLRSVQRLRPALHPHRHSQQRIERAPIAAQRGGIEEPRHDLMQGVEGRPGRLSGPQPVEQLFREGAHVAAADRCLALRQRGGHEYAALARRPVAGLRP